MSTLQVEFDNATLKAADSLFESLGLDTATAVKIFISASINSHGIPFAVKHASDNSGSYVCQYGHFHDYSRINIDDYQTEIATAKGYADLAEMWPELDAEDDDDI